MRTVPAACLATIFTLAPVGQAAEPGAAVQGLALTSEVHVVPGVPEGRFTLKVVFRNDGAKALTFFVPEFFESNHFPGWRFVREDGAAFVPYDAPFQSMWTEGLQGSTPELAPGKSWAVEHTVDLVVADSGSASDDAALTPLPLAPGRYRVECAYEKKDASVPIGGPDFSVTSRTLRDLWTGRVEAKPLTLEVPRPRIVTLRIDAPRNALPGKPYLVGVVLTNGRETPVTLEGALRVSVSSKPHGTASARVRLAEPVTALAAAESQTLTLAAGETRRFTLDLAGLALAKGGEGKAALSLAAFVEQGMFALEAAFETAREADTLHSNGLWRSVNEAQAPR